MNLLSKKTILKAYSILQTIFVVFFTIIILTNNAFVISLSIKYNLDLGEEFTKTTILIPTIIYLLYVIYYVALLLCFRRKIHQNKQQFYKNIVLFRILSILCFFIDFLLAILLIVCAFAKDDGLDEIILPPKPKKPKKQKLPSETKKQISALKSKRKHGLISQEKYEKEYKKIIKNMNNAQINTNNNNVN